MSVLRERIMVLERRERGEIRARAEIGTRKRRKLKEGGEIGARAEIGVRKRRNLKERGAQRVVIGERDDKGL